MALLANASDALDKCRTSKSSFTDVRRFPSLLFARRALLWLECLSSQRKALYERLLFALQNYKDPWAEIFEDKSGGTLKREFEIIKV